MTNQEFCLFVYQNINIKGICYKLGIWRDTEDMEQIIYEIIMSTPNRKLNDVFERRHTLTWVYRVIFNQLDHGEWRDMEKIKVRMEQFDETDTDYNWEKEEKLAFLDEEFKSIRPEKIVRMNYRDQQYFIGKEVLKNKLKKKWTLDEMRDKFGMSRNSINDMIQQTKRELRNRYEKRMDGSNE